MTSENPSAVAALAAEVHARLLAADPLTASDFGLSAYDALLPDVSATAAEQLAADLRALLARAGSLQPADPADPAGAVTLAALRAAAEGGLAVAEVGTVEFTLSTFEHGPALLLLAASHTHPATPAAAAAHLERARGYAAYVDACAERLRAGLAAGRAPVRALAERTAAHLAGWLEGTSPDPLSQVAVGADRAGELAELVASSTRPAIARYQRLVTEELLPAARDDEHAGMCALPGGRADYERLVALHTTLPVTAEQVHETGLAALEELGAQMAELGARLGLGDLPAVVERVRRSNLDADPQAALVAARQAVQAAERVAPQWFSPPLPAPCLVEPMDAGVARAGMAPHYVPPTEDGGRAGTYAFNAEIAGAGGGWDLEAVTYHETVPGHHLQIARDQLQADLPGIQKQWIVTAMAEGWGLYAEVLAGEMGLYSSDQARLGALGAQAFRAARLVVDTGLHAFGWSRQRAIDLMVTRVPLPAGMLAAEVDRYLAMPGQALAYMTGQRELLALRAEARAALGDAFDIRGFHDAVLGHGQVPLPAVRASVQAWTASRR